MLSVWQIIAASFFGIYGAAQAVTALFDKDWWGPVFRMALAAGSFGAAYAIVGGGV